MKKLVLALAAVALIATPAMADFSFYGSARVNTFYTNVDDATTTTKNFDVDLQNNSRFGAKATTGDVSGRVEIGFDDNAATSTRTYLRLIYGEVKLGDGTLLVGQTYTPYTKLAGMVSSVDQGLENFGALYDGRNTQIKYTMNNGVYFAALDNLGAGTEVIIPKLNIGYAGKAGDVNYNVGFAYQTYEASAVLDVDSYLAYICGDAKVGEIGLIYGLHYGQNLQEFGMARTTISSGANKVAASVTNDTKSYGAMLEAAMNGFKVGIGYVSDENDDFTDADTQMALYANYTVQVAKGFSITPEVSYWDYMEDAAGIDEGDDLYVGAKWQLDF